MWANPLLLVALAVAAPPDVKNHFLAEGIDKYDNADYAGALQSLTQALDQSSSRKDLSKIHLYIGLIQHRYKLKEDAEASFDKALGYDPKLKLPKGTSKGTKALFLKIKKAKFGETDTGEMRADEGKKKRHLKRRDGNGNGDETAAVEPSGTSSTAVHQTSATIHTDDESDTKRSFSDENDELPTVHPRPPGDNTKLEPPAGSVRVETGSSGTQVAGWISIGVGAAGAVTGTTFGVLAGINGSDALSEQVASRSAELHARAVQQRTLAFVSFGVSLAALGLAAVLFLTD